MAGAVEVMTDAQLKELPAPMPEFIDAYLAHDPQAMAALYAPDCRLSLPAMEFRGRDQIQGMWAAWFRAFPDVTSDTFRAPRGANVVALEWEERGTHLGRLTMPAIADIPPTGRKLRWRGVSIYALGEAGIESVDYHVDALALARLLATPRAVPALAAAGFNLFRDARRRR